MKRSLILALSIIVLMGVEIGYPTAHATDVVIGGVSPITTNTQATIVITGSGFGDTPPQTTPVGDGSVDTIACGVNTPSIAIRDNGGGADSWSAGRETCTNFDAIGIYLSSWTDSQIVINGFGTALGTDGQKTWNIAVGDPIQVALFGPNNASEVDFALTVTSPTGTSWSPLTPSISPSARSQASMVNDAADGYTVLFGGANSTYCCFGDTWTFAANTWTKLSTGNSPPAREAGSMVYDAANGYVLLFGGSAVSGALGDTWIFSNGHWTQLNPTISPAPRSWASIAYDAADGYVVLFGGASSSGSTPYYSDSWEFKAGTWTQLSPTQSPSPRAGQGMVYDPADGYVILFGGTSNFASSGAGLGDTWKFQGGSWTQLSPSVSPSDRYTYGIAYDSSLSSVVLFGGWVPAGACGNPVGDTWQFTTGAWVQLSPTQSPSARQVLMMDYDPNLGGVLLFGGQENPGAGPSTGCGTPSTDGDSWEFSAQTVSPDFTLTARPTTLSVVQGAAGSDTVTVMSLGGFSGTVTLRVSASARLTVTLAPASVVMSGSAMMTVNSTAATPVGTYLVNVTGVSGILSHRTTVTVTVTRQTVMAPFFFATWLHRVSLSRSLGVQRWSYFAFNLNGNKTVYAAITVTGIDSGGTSTFTDTTHVFTISPFHLVTGTLSQTFSGANLGDTYHFTMVIRWGTTATTNPSQLPFVGFYSLSGSFTIIR
jgi:hypothetical protein